MPYRDTQMLSKMEHLIESVLKDWKIITLQQNGFCKDMLLLSPEIAENRLYICLGMNWE